MKKIKIFTIFVCLVCVALFCGCGSQELASAKITRDDARTGGSLSFVYDSSQRIVYIGGEGEIVQFSTADETKGLEAGNRVGLKVTSPDEEIDLSSATLEMNGVKYSSGDFLESVNGQKQRFFNIYPLVSAENSEVKFVIKWQESSKEQEYKIVIVDGTLFMDSDGNVK